MIDDYVHNFRPTLMRGTNEDWLFPGQRRGPKGKICLSGQITDRIWKEIGLRITTHQFRHAAGAIILMERPGEYELVRQILGHRSVQTTINSYVGLENIRGSEIFSKLVIDHMNDDQETERAHSMKQGLSLSVNTRVHFHLVSGLLPISRLGTMPFGPARVSSVAAPGVISRR